MGNNVKLREEKTLENKREERSNLMEELTEFKVKRIIETKCQKAAEEANYAVIYFEVNGVHISSTAIFYEKSKVYTDVNLGLLCHEFYRNGKLVSIQHTNERDIKRAELVYDPENFQETFRKAYFLEISINTEALKNESLENIDINKFKVQTY